MFVNFVYLLQEPAFSFITSWETLGWKKDKLESRLPGEISITSYPDDTILMAESEEELESLDESEKGELKIWLKAQHSEN